jgi:phosphohistidine phosphatase SixA
MKITFIRHGHCYNQNNYNIINPSLTERGIKEANKLNGYYDLVIISPMNRTMETFNNSKIDCQKNILNVIFREHITNPSDLINNETEFESSEEFDIRLIQIKDYLNILKQNPTVKNICIISHSVLIFNLLKILGIQNHTYLSYGEKYSMEI